MNNRPSQEGLELSLLEVKMALEPRHLDGKVGTRGVYQEGMGRVHTQSPVLYLPSPPVIKRLFVLLDHIITNSCVKLFVMVILALS